MTVIEGLVSDVFADSAFWIALIAKRDQYHKRAQAWSCCIAGRIITSRAVLVETANGLCRDETRASVVALIEQIEANDSVEVVPFTEELWQVGWQLFRTRQDKEWGLTDCLSFAIMKHWGLQEALTSDNHFTQAGYRALLLEDAVHRDAP